MAFMAAPPPDKSPMDESRPPDQAGIPTIQPAQGSDPHSTTIDDSRFPPGTLLSERYRIVGRIGKGGMGEVYRADDLKLGQSVVFKFLPQDLAGDAVWLKRLHDEVRIAREVAHPNVCRVYDISAVDGDHFITMEYVDGEDLTSLLRRIGHLPKDKAIQIARQLCAGIAAAHERNVLHRDLKPANIMLDGRGHVRITDFGIAALADQIDGKTARAGTPAYMAPEQLAGQHVTRRSDIYSLGLVLYEVFTGREAFHADSAAQLKRMRESGPPTTPSSFVQDMDPLVERVILRCLENDPADRPGSAIAVAAALPGGDPLAAALAAGETPSPEMIVEAGEKGGLSPAVALPCLAAVVIVTIVSVFLRDPFTVTSLVPFHRSPQVLADTASRIVADLGYPDAPADRAGWFSVADEYLEHIKETDESPGRWDRLAAGRPAAVAFSYSSSPEPMVPGNVAGRVRWDDPPLTTPGMIRMNLDTEGRLMRFEAVAPGTLEAPPSQPELDWSTLFAAAGLDPAEFHRTSPTWTPTVYCDTGAAWLGVYPEAPDTELRIEAGAFAGKPVYFELIGPWQEPRGTPDPMEAGEKVAASIFLTLFFLVLIGAGLIVWRHLRAGRGDRKGAARLAIYVFGIAMGSWIFQADHVLAMGELGLISRAFASAAGFAVICWILYVAIEPYARRHWPHAMVSWSRVLAGRFRDPLVGRDALFGCLCGLAFFLFAELGVVLVPLTGAPPPTPFFAADQDLYHGGGYIIGELFDSQSGVGIFLGAFVFLLLLRIVLRLGWLANTAFVLVIFGLFTEGLSVKDPGWIVVWLTSAAMAVIVLVTMIRFGLLSLIVMAFTAGLCFQFPATLDFSRWYAGTGIVGPVVVVGLAAYGFWISLAGRPLFRDELLET